MDRFEQQLVSGLGRLADSTDLRVGRIAQTVRRGRQLRARRRRAVAAGGAGVLVAAGAGVFAWTGRDGGGRITTIGTPGSDPGEQPGSAATAQPTGPSSSAAPASVAPSGRLVPSPFAWSVAEPDALLSTLHPFVIDPVTGYLYSIATSPGTSGPRSVDSTAIRSADGVSWDRLGTIKDNGFVRSLGVYDGRLYSVGTASITEPLTSGDDFGDVVTRTAGADGDFDTRLLPGVDVRGIRRDYGFAFSFPYGIASGPHGTMVAEAVGTAPTQVAERFGAPVDPNEEVTVADLRAAGIPEDALRLASATPRFFLSTDGATFEEVSAPSFESDGMPWVALLAAPDGFYALVVPRVLGPIGEQAPTDMRVWWTADGLAWEERPSISGVTYVRNAWTADGVVRAIVDTGDGPAIAQLEGGSWTVRTLDIPWDEVITEPGPTDVYTLAARGSEIAVVGMQYPDPIEASGGYRVDHEHYSFVVRSRQDAVVVDEGGHEIGRPWDTTDTGRTRPQPDGGTDVLDETGTVVDTFSEAELSAANEAAVGTSPDVQPQFFLAYSSDLGATWSIDSLDTLTGGTVTNANPAFTSDGLLVLTDAGSPGRGAAETSATEAPDVTTVGPPSSLRRVVIVGRPA